MDASSLFFGIFPLLIFVIIDSFTGMKTAIIVATILALVEGIFSYYYLGEIDWITYLSIGLIIVLSLISYLKKSSLHFKLQPAILSVVIGLTLLITYWMDRPLLFSLMIKYKSQLPLTMQQQLGHPLFQSLIKLSTLTTGYAMLLHGAATAWAAFRLSNWWWLIIRGIGFYLFNFLAILLAKFHIGL